MPVYFQRPDDPLQALLAELAPPGSAFEQELAPMDMEFSVDEANPAAASPVDMEISLEEANPSAMAAPAPAPAPARPPMASPGQQAMGALAMPSQQPMEQPQAPMGPQRITLPEPPPVSPPQAPDDSGAIIAAFLDAFLNKGRNIPVLLGPALTRQPADPGAAAMEDWQRRFQHARAEAQLNRPTGLSPEALELRRRRLELGEKKESRLAESGEYKLNRLRQEQDPQSEISQNLRERIYEWNPDLSGTLDSATYEDMAKLPDVKKMLQEQMEDRRRGKEGQEFNRRQAVQFGYQKRGMAEADMYAQRRERRAELRMENAEDRNFADKFNTKHGTDLDIAALVQDVDAGGGAAPQSVWERLGTRWFADRGIDPQRMEAWQAKQMALEMWARGQTGAAISESENETFAVQTGLSATASPEQIEAAYKVMERIIQRRLRRAAVGHKDAARDIGAAGGLDVDRWFGSGAQAPRRRQRAPERDADLNNVQGLQFK